MGLRNISRQAVITACWGALTAATLAGSVYAALPPPPQVSVEQGRLQGVARDGYDAFLGIPFAAAPVGPFRWTPPQTAERWTGVRQAVRFQSKCSQNALVPPLTRSGDENCLFLNVYRPHTRTTKRPVIVWFHGGGFTLGSSQDVDGSVLAQRGDAVIVTVNYRLGVFGFLSLPQLDAESKEHTSGNYGILDQQASLRWVHANIAQFGGNPDNVTLMGQSAGGESVRIHLSSSGSVGLFSRAIVLSGPVIEGTSKADEQQHGPSSRIVARLGCGTETKVLTCIRSRPTTSVYDAGGGSLTRAAGWLPITDGVVITDTTLKLAGADAVRVPILSGTVAMEGGFWVQGRRAAGINPWTAENYRVYLSRIPMGDDVGVHYPVASYRSPDDAYTAIVTDFIACGNVAMKRAALARQQPYFMYEFNDPDAPSTVFDVPNPAVGPFHVSDVPYFFQTGFPSDEKPDLRFTQVQRALSDRMIADVRAFAHGETLRATRWTQDSVLALSPQGDRRIAFEEFATQHNCMFWAGIKLKQTPL